MPYSLKRSKKGKGWEIVKKDTGEVVGHSDNIHKARASIAYREQGENKRT